MRRALVLWVAVVSGCAGADNTAAEGKATGSVTGGTPGAMCVANANRARATKSEKELESITLKQVLVHQADSKNAKDGLSRSREEACLRAAEARDKVVAGAEFDDAIKNYSDEAGAASRNGMVGTVRREDLVKPVAEAAFALEVNEMSDVVETPFGFHLLLRAP